MPSSSHTTDRAARIESLVLEYGAAQLQGTAPSREEFLATHRELLPELRQQLDRFDLILAARQRTRPANQADRNATVQHQSQLSGLLKRMDDSSAARLRVRCPHCQSSMEVSADTPWSEMTCETCGSQFNIAAGPAEEANLTAISQVGHFELIERIGLGGFGSVWRARDRELDRIVALKIPRRGQLTDRESEQFLREARAAAQLEHANIVRVYECGRDTENDTIFIACELIEGTTLADRITQNRPSVGEAVQLCRTVALALEQAHGAGVVHRDLKPSNILLDGSGTPYVADFGLAKRKAAEVTITVHGDLMGTPAYMAPEQARGDAHESDARSDIYSLGVVLFQLLTGELPFRGLAATLLHQVIHDEPPSPRKLNRHVSRDLETICLKCLEKDPDRRFQSARALADELLRLLNGEPIKTRPVGPAGRLLRWCRRKPLIASLSAAAILLLAGGSIVSTFFALKSNRSARQAKAALLDADRRLYAHDMVAVQQAVEADQGFAALAFLERYLNDSNKADLRSFEWNYWWRRVHQRAAALYQADTRFACVAFAPDQHLLAWGGDEPAVYLCDEQLKAPRKLLGHTGKITDVEFSPDGQVLASASVDGTVRLWDADHGELLQAIPVGAHEPCRVGFAADGSWLATTGHNEEPPGTAVSIWSCQDWSPVTTLPVIERTISYLESSADSLQLIASTDAGFAQERSGWQLFSWEIATGRPHPLAAGGAGGAIAVAFDGKAASIEFRNTSSQNQDILLFTVGLAPAKKIARNNLGAIAELVFSPDGSALAVASSHKTVEVYDCASAELKLLLQGHGSRVRGIDFRSDGRALASASDDGSIRIWNLQSATNRQIQTGSDKPILDLAISPDGAYLACCQDRHVCVFSLVSRQRVDQLEVLGRSRSVAFAHDGKSLYFSGNGPPAGGYAGRWEPGGDVTYLKQDSSTPLSEVVCSPDGRQIAVATQPGGPFHEQRPCQLFLFDADSLKQQADFFQRNPAGQGHVISINAVDFAADGKHLMTSGGRDRTVKLWHASSGELLHVFRRPRDIYPVTAADLSGDGTLVAVGSSDGPITLWSTATGDAVGTLLGHTDRVEGVVFSPDETTLFSGGRDRAVKIWDTASGRLRSTLNGHQAPIQAMAISPTGHLLVTGDAAGSIRIWDGSPLAEDDSESR